MKLPDNENKEVKRTSIKSFIKNDGSGIVYFIIILLVSHFFWKFFVQGDENGDQVTFFGLDISQPFIYMAEHIAIFSHKILNFLGFETTLHPNNVVRHNVSRNAVCIIWGCTGIKQAYIYFCIIAFYKGSWKHKAWYIPVGFVFVYLFNLFRIVFITGIIDKHPTQFEFWHEHVLKYAFYALIFLLWVVWNEKFVGKPLLTDGE
ncbi:MAG: archaeosortase/exosortase family protein [Porphyromonadaceae bacterium]|nr:archaeosortase/exosortase family protein [Porphyromonadaceae bacterium]